MASFDYMVVGASFNRSVVFNFERDFHEPTFKKWMLANWSQSFVYAGGYVLAILLGQRWMEGRAGFQLRPYLATWSALLAIFSVFGSIRTLPGLVFDIATQGFHYAACGNEYYSDSVTAFWCFLFTVSKVLELGDTLFIVLRKQRLIFLHWYHHITVLLYAWYSYSDHTALGRWFMVMNYMVHSCMYTYYAFRALGYRSPKWVMMAITSLQILQMVFGVSLNLYIYTVKNRGGFCQQTYNNLSYAFLMYLSYFVLFGHFFYSTYLARRRQTQEAKKVQ